MWSEMLISEVADHILQISTMIEVMVVVQAVEMEEMVE